MWVAAHPDDESLAAPLLGRLCVDEQLRCTFLVFTRGEAGRCRLPGGCRPDLGTVREAEMSRAARLFRASATIWRLPDGGGGEDPTAKWAAAMGGRQRLLDEIRKAVGLAAPDILLTFDPRHGSTCHPDHRAVARLLLEALDGRTTPSLYFLETVLKARDGIPVAFSPAAGAGEGVIGFDAGSTYDGAGRPFWRFLLDDLAVHRSQFDSAVKGALAGFPPRQRVVYFGQSTGLQQSDRVFECL
jgi:LmbE family N-acetylglucosaminyl deacetylase